MTVRITVYGAQATGEAVQLSTEGRLRVAQQIAVDARAAAPVVKGDYRDGITVEQDGTRVSVVDNDPTSGFKEYGTSDTPAHAVLTNAARQHGKYTGIQPRRR